MNEYKNMECVRKRIELNYQFSKELEKNIEECKNSEEKLKNLELIGRVYSEYVTGIYSSNFLENEIINIGKEINFCPSTFPQKGKILHVMTCASNVGGHSTIVYNWIKNDKRTQYSIVFTDMCYSEVPSFILKSVIEANGEILCLNGNYFEKSLQLLEFSQNFERIVLHTHMYDVIPLLAYSNENWKIPVYLYNHADFRFTYGFAIADVVLNLNKFDLNKTQMYRGVDVKKNKILQSPNGGYVNELKEDNEVKEYIIRKYKIDRHVKLVVSMGDDFKYQDIIDYSFTDFVEKLINKSKEKIQFIIIGPNPQKEKWKKLEKSTNGYARAIGYVDRREAYNIIKLSNLFIASFPMRASGAGLAEKFGIPNLSLFIIEREKEFFKNNSVESVDELIDKSLDILNGNTEKYKGCCMKYQLTAEKWNRKWHSIIEKYSIHSINLFESKRCVGMQEYVNCQLMQNVASDNVQKYIKANRINGEFRKKLYELDKKYQMQIFKKNIYEDYNDEIENFDKYYKLYKTSIKWNWLKQKGKKVDVYLYNEGYRTVAIYGIGYMGKCLMSELTKTESKIEVLYGIDRNINVLNSNIKIVRPSDMLKQVDVIINTTCIDNRKILSGMMEKKIPIIRFDKILEDMDSNFNTCNE